jgi:hypothetical protein
LAAVAILSRPAIALGQDEPSRAEAPRAPGSSSALTINKRQIEAFANLVDEPINVVAKRLRQDPTLIPVAVAAAQTRLSRKTAGKWMMVGGFSLSGLGSAAMFYAFLNDLGKQELWCENNSCPKTPMSSEDQGIMVGGLVAAGIGLALAIPGIVMVARQTEIETEAVSRFSQPKEGYESPFPQESARKIPSGWAARTISIPLLALTF